jgi:hypothetical protein
MLLRFDIFNFMALIIKNFFMNVLLTGFGKVELEI